MRRYFLLGLLAIFTLVPFGYTEPTGGGTYFRENIDRARPGEDKDQPVPGTAFFEREFVGGQRACALAIGDHDPEVLVGISVYELNKGKAGKRVAQDQGRKNDKEFQDYAAAIWFPTRTKTYRIEVRSYGRVENVVAIALN